MSWSSFFLEFIQSSIEYIYVSVVVVVVVVVVVGW